MMKVRPSYTNGEALQVENAASMIRWLWYALIATGLVVVLIFWANASPSKTDQRYDPWVQFAILSLFVFGYLLKWGWRHKRCIRFWQLYALLLLAHGAIFGYILSYGRLPTLILAVAGCFEFVASALAVVLIVGQKH